MSIMEQQDRKEKDLIVFARAFHQSGAFQSLASLIAALESYGRRVHLITQSEPSGDDFVSCDSLKRYSIDVYETRGYSTEEAFFKIVSEIPADTVIFAGDLYAKTIQFFQTAKRLGRCVVFDTDRSPLYYVGAGSEKLSMSCMYMIRHADLVVTHSETDCDMIRGMGAKKCAFMPFYFPYFDKEVGAASFTGGRFVYYTTYAGRNTRTPITAFARVHAQYPDARMIVVPIGVRKSAVLEELVRDIRETELNEYISIETDVLKPMRFLREADVSITYGHLITVPETVIESMSAGIPAILLQDADYSQDSLPCVHLSASDEDALVQQMLYFMPAEKCEAYSQKARALLDVDYRRTIAASFDSLLTEVYSAYTAQLSAARAELSRLQDEIRPLTAADAVRTLRTEGISAQTIFGVLLGSGTGYSEIRSAFYDSGIGIQDALRMQAQSDVFSVYERVDPQSFRARAVIYADIVARLAACGLDAEEIAAFYPEIYLTAEQVCLILQQTLTTELCLRDFQPTGDSPAAVNAMQAFRSYNLENARYQRTKAHPGVQRALKYYDWKMRPWAQHGMIAKLLLLPSRVIDRLKKYIQMHGRQRLLKRKVVEVDPADVRKIQLMVLNLMLEFERICKKHGLRYYLAGGTILGGIRHKGFIPWDDDMDITMPRPDYDKFLKIAQKELPANMKLDKDCVPFCHNRIEYRDTRFDTMWRNGGIFLDLLALDGSPDDERQRRRHEHKTRFWRFWMLERARPIPPMSASRDVQMIILKRVIARLMPRWFLKWRWHSWAARYDCSKTSSWVCLPASIYTYEQERFPKEYWGEPVMMEFEGYDMPTMQHWEDYLICHFGNYMKMPPETLRKSHHFIYHYDLGSYKDIPTEELEQQLVGPKKKKEVHSS